MTLRIRIRLFALQRELAGTRQLDVHLQAPATIADAWAALAQLHPVLAPGAASVRYARNGVYASADEPLEDGDEVAMIPPVSGGADAADEVNRPAPRHPDERPSRILELTEQPFGPEILGTLAARLATPEDGAVVGFLGVTRRTPGTPAPGQESEAARHAGRSVEGLEYEALEPLALRVFHEIADEVRDRFGVERFAVVHRTGEVPLGEASVAIVACSAHRAAAFEAASYAMDETKARAPIWKAERFVDGHVWIGAPAREGPRPPS